MKTLIYSFVLLSSTLFFAQDGISLPFTNSDYVQIPGLSSMEQKEAMGKKKDKPLVGSPYLFSNWLNESQIFFNDKIYKFNLFNYNVYSERFEAKVAEDSVFIINPGQVDKVIIRNRQFKRYVDPEFQRNSYFEQIAQTGDYQILRKYFTKIREGSVNPLTKEHDGSPELLQYEVYYLLNGESTDLQKFKLGKSSVMNLMDKQYYKDVNSFIKLNKLKFRNIEDVAKIIKYYDAISH